MAFFPGIALHGVGHAYAGNTRVFGNLFLAEFVSVASMVLGSPSNADIGPVFLGGICLFALTWVYDIAGAQAAAKKFNLEHKYRLTTALNPEIRAIGLKLAAGF